MWLLEYIVHQIGYAEEKTRAGCALDSRGRFRRFTVPAAPAALASRTGPGRWHTARRLAGPLPQHTSRSARQTALTKRIGHVHGMPKCSSDHSHDFHSQP